MRGGTDPVRNLLILHTKSFQTGGNRRSDRGCGSFVAELIRVLIRGEAKQLTHE